MSSGAAPLLCPNLLPAPLSALIKCKTQRTGRELNMNPSSFPRQTVCQQDVSSAARSKRLRKQLEKVLRSRTAGGWRGEQISEQRYQRPSSPLHYLTNSFQRKGIWSHSDLCEGCSACAEAKQSPALPHLPIRSTRARSTLLSTRLYPLPKDVAAC